MLTKKQEMWIRVTANRFRCQSAIKNPAYFFELSFLGDIHPHETFNHDEGLKFFLEKVKGES